MALREYDYENIPTVSIVKKILTDAIKMEATDIHFDPTPDELIIKFRINGDLKEYTIAPENVKANIITRVKILASMNITDSLLPGTGAISFELNNETHNMTVSSLPIVDGEKIVVHISNYAQNIKNLHSIGFTEANTNKIKSLLNEQQGIILITGNTNSGKSTTLYSILKELNSSANNIISIENPVKMRIKGINQVNISPEKGLTYRNALKSVMLQDPNIIAINELVDDETTRSALRASVSGRLVISTMHTKTAYQTIDTLLHRDIENYLLGSNLIGIISQRLVKKLCPSCRKLQRATPYEASIFKEVLGTDITEIYSPNGCIECNDGYIDQIPVAEVIEIDEELRNAISNNRNRDLIKNIIYEENDSIIKDGLKKVLEGKTSFQEVMRIIDLRVDFDEKKSKIRNIILGNGLPEEPTSLPKKEEGKIEEPQKILSEKSEQEEPMEEQAFPKEAFIKVELENTPENTEKTLENSLESPSENSKQPEEGNITNLKVSEKELKNILSQIEENASSLNSESKEPSNTSPKNESKSEIAENNNEPIKIENEQVPPEETAPLSDELKTTTPEIKEEENIPENTKELNEITNTQDDQQENETKNSEEQSADTKTNIEEPANPEPTPTEGAQENKSENENIATQTNTPSEIAKEESTPAPINFDDDDDDDDDNFNYGNSYINNF